MGRICLVSFVSVAGKANSYIGQGFDQGHMEVVLDFRNPLAQIVLEKVLELAGKLDTGRTSADDNHVQEALDFFVGLVLEDGSLNAVHDTLADFLGIADLFEEAGVLTHTGDT